MSYRDDLLQKLMEESERGNLPPLKDDLAQGYVEKIMELVKKHLEPFIKWLSSFFGRIDVSNSWEVTRAIIVAVITLVVFYFSFLLVKRLLSSKSKAQLSISQVEAENELDLILQDAVSNNDWKRAMRIRWLIFTQEKGLPSSCTPLMYASKMKQSFDEKIYQSMFGKPNVTAEEFELYSESLKAMEAA